MSTDKPTPGDNSLLNDGSPEHGISTEALGMGVLGTGEIADGPITAEISSEALGIGVSDRGPPADLPAAKPASK